MFNALIACISHLSHTIQIYSSGEKNTSSHICFTTIAYICHNRHDRQCAFFKPVSLSVEKFFGSFWPLLAILSRIYALFGAPFSSLNSVMVPQNGQIWGMLTTSLQLRGSEYLVWLVITLDRYASRST